MNAIIIEVKEIPEDCYHCEIADIETGWCKYAEIFIDHRTEPGKRYAGCPMESMPEYEKLKEKDRAKKPDLEGDGYDPDGNMVYDTWICPNCEKRYEVDYDDYDFCPKCGQRIDWGEGES